jgi:hypothetical protein
MSRSGRTDIQSFPNGPLSKNSDITGQRHLNEHTRVNVQNNQSKKSGAAEFKKLAEQHLPPDHPLHPKNRPG